MSETPSVSVIVVSRGRPSFLKRCLTGIGQLWYQPFEVVVVADTSGCDAVAAWRDQVKIVSFEEANISKARNLGITVAAGDIVVFIDDDSVPEPTWLSHLVAPFADKDVCQTGGYVRGRNGISFQWRARCVDALGEAREIANDDDEAFAPLVPEGCAAKTEGTNMALRRDVIAGIGGFDPAFRFFLDETDVNLRLRHQKTILVPLAQVHHGYAESPVRGATRAPTDLTEIGASTAVFLRKHAADRIEIGKNRAFLEQRDRAIGHMVMGRLEPSDVASLLASFDHGFRQGIERTLEPLKSIGAAEQAFSPFPSRPRGSSVLLSGRPWSKQRLETNAETAVEEGHVATVFRFSPTAVPHRVSFKSNGYWEQTGGLFGPAERSEPPFRLTSFRRRVRRERARLGLLRNL